MLTAYNKELLNLIIVLWCVLKRKPFKIHTEILWVKNEVISEICFSVIWQRSEGRDIDIDH